MFDVEFLLKLTFEAILLNKKLDIKSIYDLMGIYDDKKLNNLLKILENSNANINQKKLDITQLVEGKNIIKVCI